MNTNLDKTIFFIYAKDIIENSKVKQLSFYLQHGRVTRLEHSMYVAQVCYSVAKKFLFVANIFYNN